MDGWVLYQDASFTMLTPDLLFFNPGKRLIKKCNEIPKAILKLILNYTKKKKKTMYHTEFIRDMYLDILG